MQFNALSILVYLLFGTFLPHNRITAKVIKTTIQPKKKKICSRNFAHTYIFFFLNNLSTLWIQFTCCPIRYASRRQHKPKRKTTTTFQFAC